MNAQQKRTAEEADSLLEGVNAILVDIEGTTTPIDFVKETLFPYVTENIETYLQSKYDDDETKKDIAALVDLATKDKEEKVDGVVEIPAPNGSNKDDVIKAVCNNVKWQMENDRKSTALKDLQGHIWREAYKSGKVKAELFEDVYPALQQLTDPDYGIKIYVYSSGSVEAQKLLFANTEEGDICEVFTDYFDTTIGGKREVESYKKIAAKIGVDAGEILFLTDTPEEAEAASKANLRCALVAREGNEDLTEKHFQDFLVIESFGELFGDDENEEEFKRLAREEGDDDDDEEEDLGEEDEDDVEDEEDDEEEDPDDDDDA